MTKKQQKILESALEMFAKYGFNGTSTAKIAKAANVSEGLIFRHFDNKQGLLQAIIDEGKIKAETIFSQLSTISDAKVVLKSILNFAFNIDENEANYWKLLYAIKWQSESYDSSNSMYLKKLAKGAFKELNYEDPDAEAQLLLLLIDGIAMTVLLRKPTNVNDIRDVLYRKYNLH